jgi:hypothetical protein
MSNRTSCSRKRIVGLLLLFLLLSLTDLLLTWALLHREDRRFDESNPVASWCLSAHGWEGVTAGKLGLVVLVGGLAVAIAYRRPHTGEMLLVFACGALSTVVMHSLFLGWPQGGRGPDVPDGSRVAYVSMPDLTLIQLVEQQPVQEELRLSQSEVIRFADFAARRTEMLQKSGAMSQDEWNALARAIADEQQALLCTLEPWQLERLRQINVQQLGNFAFNDMGIVKELQISDEQRRAIHGILDQLGVVQPPAPRRLFGILPLHRVEDENSRVRTKILGILTPDQRETWKRMTGEPFKAKDGSRDSRLLSAE